MRIGQRRFVRRAAFAILLLAFSLTAGEPAGAGDSIALSYLSAANTCNWPSSHLYSVELQAPAGAIVTKLRMQFLSTTADADFMANAMEIYADNNNSKGTLIGTLSASSIAAPALITGAFDNTRIGTFTGSITIPSTGKYWLAQQPNGVSITACQAATMVSQTTGWSQVMSGSSFQIMYGSSVFSFGTIPSYEVTATPSPLLSFNSMTSNLSGSTSSYRSPTAITANVSAQARIAFYSNGKKVPGCVGLLATGSGSSYSVVCNWRPSIHGTPVVTAKAAPTDGGAIVSATLSPIGVWARTGNR